MVIYSQGKAILPIKFRIPIWPRYLPPLEVPKIPQILFARKESDPNVWTPVHLPPETFLWTEEDQRPCQKWPGNQVIVNVTGTLGTIRQGMMGDFAISMNGETWAHECTWPDFCPKGAREYHNNLVYERLVHMTHGVSAGFEKRLRLSGKGYRAWMDKRKLILKCGFLHLVTFYEPPGVHLEVEDPGDELGHIIKIRSLDYTLAGWIADKIRQKRKMDKSGHGFRYDGEPIVKCRGSERIVVKK